MTSCELSDVRRALRELADPETARFLQRYFKTGAGEYGAGDCFMGIRVPQLRRLGCSFRALPLDSVTELLRSSWHEERLLALLILVERYPRSQLLMWEAIHHLYLDNTSHINNWDLVDASAERIVGAHLDPLQIVTLENLAGSASVWERRIAVMATFHWVKQRTFQPTLRMADLLLNDPHDLIHKAVGWMLREVGKRDMATELGFLKERYRSMPRTMLRYAIERLPENDRQLYLKGVA